MTPKASSWLIIIPWYNGAEGVIRGEYWCPKGTSRLQTVTSTRSYMYACKKHIDILINYDAEGVILSKINTLSKWRPRRHPRRISVPEGHLTPSTVISTRSHMHAWKKHIDILINYDAKGVIRKDIGDFFNSYQDTISYVCMKAVHWYIDQLWRRRRHLK